MFDLAVLLTGTVGVGKTTVGSALAEHLGSVERPASFVDLDHLARLWPAPSGDPFRWALVVESLAALAPTHVAAGARKMVLAGVIDSDGDRADLESALTMPLRVIRLVAPPAVVAARLRERHTGVALGGLSWHLARAPELEAIIEHAGIDADLVDADASLPTVVDRVLEVL